MRWWNWLLTIPKANSPAFDPTGSHANIGQVDPDVFFLCQTVEGVDHSPVRKVTIPRGLSVFMPLINWISTLHVDGDTDEDLIRVSREKMDVVSNLQVLINNQSLSLDHRKLRVCSPVFELILPKDNILDIQPGKRRFSTDGYWLFLNILSDSLRLDTFGSCSSGLTRISISYHIQIS